MLESIFKKVVEKFILSRRSAVQPEIKRLFKWATFNATEDDKKNFIEWWFDTDMAKIKTFQTEDNLVHENLKTIKSITKSTTFFANAPDIKEITSLKRIIPERITA